MWWPKPIWSDAVSHSTMYHLLGLESHVSLVGSKCEEYCWQLLQTRTHCVPPPILGLAAAESPGGRCITTPVTPRERLLFAGNGKLEPPKSDAAARADFLQWTIVAETGLTAGLADLFWHTIQFPEEKRKPQVAERGKDL
jgi:hypothetical protein